MKKLLIGLTLLASMSSFASSDLVGNYTGITEKGEECQVEISFNKQQEYKSMFYVDGNKKIEILSKLYITGGDKKFIKAGRHNIECADNGSFCFWPFETSDKVLMLDNEGSNSLQRVSYYSQMSKWSHGEGNYEVILKDNCKNLVKN